MLNVERLPIFLAALFALLARPAAAAEDFAYVSLAAVPRDNVVVVDARPIEDCRRHTFAGARCLPADEFLGPHKRLPSARDMLWLLGTAGLKGDETVLVAGQDATARDFIAGVLYVAGQRQVWVLAEPISRALESGLAAGRGRERGMTRETVFEAPMRDKLLVLRDELRAMRPLPVLLDGRTEAEYWGERARAARGGHLPGAVSLSALQLRAALNAAVKSKPVLPGGRPIAYAHDAWEGLAYLTLLRAGHGLPARLYAEGWAEWAADGALPADAVAYPEHDGTQRVENRSAPVSLSSRALSIGALALVLAAFAGGWFLARRRVS